MMRNRTYTELSQLQTFYERFEYLKLEGSVGAKTFGYDRYINQIFYKSEQWLRTRNLVIVRDAGCNLGVPGMEIEGKIIVHHIRVVTLKDLEHNAAWLYDPEFLICCSHKTHNAIHYGDPSKLEKPLINRRPGDTKLW